MVRLGPVPSGDFGSVDPPTAAVPTFVFGEAAWTAVSEQAADVVERHRPHPGDATHACCCGWGEDAFTQGEHVAQVLANLDLLAVPVHSGVAGEPEATTKTCSEPGCNSSATDRCAGPTGAGCEQPYCGEHIYHAGYDGLLCSTDYNAIEHRDLDDYDESEATPKEAPQIAAEPAPTPTHVDTVSDPVAADVAGGRPYLNTGTDPVSRRAYALIFNGLTRGLAEVDRFVALSERSRVSEAIYDELRTGGIEVRLTDGLERLRAVARAADAQPEPDRG